MTYLDHAATSPLLPEVLEAMLPWLRAPANPSSAHRPGQRAAAAVERARDEVAALLGRPASGIVFTSGATEATHQALRGLAGLGARTAAASAIEHPCVAGGLAASGVEVRALAVGADGVVRLEGLEAVDVVCLMAANHETGVRQPVAEAAARSRALHVDASQALGKGPLELSTATTVVGSAHKLGGPVGVGVLSLTGPEAFPPLLTGGSQERARRAGTVNVAGIVGFGAAAKLALALQAERVARWGALSERLRSGLVGLGARLVGAPDQLLPTHTCVVFEGVRGESLVQALDLEGIAASSGAACASGSTEPSPVLRAMGDPEPAGGIRISLGAGSSSGDVDRLLGVLPGILARLRSSPTP